MSRYFFLVAVLLNANLAVAQLDSVSMEKRIELEDMKLKSGLITSRIRYSTYIPGVDAEMTKFIVGDKSVRESALKGRYKDVDVRINSFFLDSDNWRCITSKGSVQSVQEGFSLVKSNTVIGVYKRNLDAEIADFSVIYGLSPNIGHGFSKVKNKKFEILNDNIILSGISQEGFNVHVVFKKGIFSYPEVAEYKIPGTNFKRRWTYLPAPKKDQLFPKKIYIEIFENNQSVQKINLEIEKMSVELPDSSQIRTKWFSPALRVEDLRLKQPVTYTYGELIKWAGGKVDLSLAELLEISKRKLNGEKSPNPTNKNIYNWIRVVICLFVLTLIITVFVNVKYRKKNKQ